MKKKKFKLLLAPVLLLTMLLTSCQGYLTSGLGEYPWYDDVELYKFLTPKNFTDEFSYIDGDYYAYESAPLEFDRDTVAILYLQYEEEVYVQAKQYMLDNTDYNEEEYNEYNGYAFYENMALAKDHDHIDENGKNSFGVAWTNFICYNDSNKILIFLGICVTSPGEATARELYKEDFGAFLKEYFSWYDFDA